MKEYKNVVDVSSKNLGKHSRNIKLRNKKEKFHKGRVNYKTIQSDTVDLSRPIKKRTKTLERARKKAVKEQKSIARTEKRATQERLRRNKKVARLQKKAEKQKARIEKRQLRYQKQSEKFNLQVEKFATKVEKSTLQYKELKDKYVRIRKSLKQKIRYYSEQGYIIDYELPPFPSFITENDLNQITSLNQTFKSTLATTPVVDYATGEIVTTNQKEIVDRNRKFNQLPVVIKDKLAQLDIDEQYDIFKEHSVEEIIDTIDSISQKPSLDTGFIYPSVSQLMPFEQTGFFADYIPTVDILDKVDALISQFESQVSDYGTAEFSEYAQSLRETFEDNKGFSEDTENDYREYLAQHESEITSSIGYIISYFGEHEYVQANSYLRAIKILNQGSHPMAYEDLITKAEFKTQRTGNKNRRTQGYQGKRYFSK